MIGSHLLSMFHFFGYKIWKNDFFLVVFRVFVGKKKNYYFLKPKRTKTQRKNENFLFISRKWSSSVIVAVFRFSYVYNVNVVLVMIGSHLLSMFHFFGYKIWKNDFFLIVFRVFVGKKKIIIF